MKIDDRIVLKPKTLRGKNRIQNSGPNGKIVQLQIERDRVISIQIQFDKEPRRLTKVVEDMMAAWQKAWPEMDFEYWRNWAYATEYNLWIDVPSNDFEILNA
jgi:hypothetical protein